VKPKRERGDRQHPPVRVPATEAAKNFGRLVDRVREERTTYVIERGGKPVAQIRPVTRASFTMADFKELAADLAGAGDEYLRAVEGAIERHNRPRARRNPWER
jgi:antitoxin (DNA-binding transcriptional repressor) of toxin-antitoxin stability system